MSVKFKNNASLENIRMLPGTSAASTSLRATFTVSAHQVSCSTGRRPVIHNGSLVTCVSHKRNAKPVLMRGLNAMDHVAVPRDS